MMSDPDKPPRKSMANDLAALGLALQAGATTRPLGFPGTVRDGIDRLVAGGKASDAFQRELASIDKLKAIYPDTTGSKIALAMKNALPFSESVAGMDAATARLQSMIESAQPIPRDPVVPRVFENPVNDTNRLLKDVKAELGAMRDLASATQAVQLEQSQVITALLKLVGDGIQSSDITEKRNARVAYWGLALAVLAIFLNVVQVAQALGYVPHL